MSEMILRWWLWIHMNLRVLSLVRTPNAKCLNQVPHMPRHPAIQKEIGVPKCTHNEIETKGQDDNPKQSSPVIHG